MRNPVRLKNLTLRFAPYYALGLIAVLYAPVEWRALAAGLVPIALGLALRAWGAGHLVKNDRLTVTGPYAYLRHPLYLGTILVAGGFALSLGGWIAPLGLAIALVWFFARYFPRKERVEAARLEALYGEAYRAYRRAVPALWPRRVAWRCGPGGDSGEAEVSSPAPQSTRWSLDCYDANNELGTLLAVLLGVALLSLRASLG